MYCPHCGREMIVDEEGVHRCVAGDMSLSQSFDEQLVARFPKHRERPASVEVGRRIGRWFCPGCGVPLTAMRCPLCNGSLREYLFLLVDIHPHRPG